MINIGINIDWGVPNLKSYHVAAGRYYVGDTQSLILNAYLGTCVAVALYDAEAEIGGLIHFLLPEPISRTEKYHPEKYASIGFPIFLKALCDAGASVENLKACIAGGALVGPLQNYDIELDIGGRTVERVMHFIANEKIPIEKSETGGFFTCCLSVNMQTWNCSIEPTGVDKLKANIDFKIPKAKEISRAIKDLKPIPQIALKIMRMINEDIYEIDALTEEIRKDQVISAKTLHLCNSAMFSNKKKIESLEHAVVMLGQHLLLKLIISASINSFFSQCGMGYSLCKGGIFHHAVSTAIVAEKLAIQTEKVSPSLAYTAGLLHDIGKVAIDQYIYADFPNFYRQLNEEKQNLIEVEKNLLGIDHTEVGGDLALNWSLPESLIETIRYHHMPEKSVHNTELVHIVYLADLLMSRFNTCLELERINTEALVSRLETIGYSIDRFPEIVNFIPTKSLEPSPELTLLSEIVY
jgi:putative nucleotidyltransferase with HDIG domain